MPNAHFNFITRHFLSRELIPSDYAGKYISKMSIHVMNEALYYLTSSPYNLNTFETYKSTLLICLAC
jgi:hypothetical protein